MTNNKHVFSIMAVAVALLILLTAIFSNGRVEPVSAAPAMAVTPVSSVTGVTSEVALVKFYDAEALTADDQNCIDLRGFRSIDLEYVSDHTLVGGANNTTTVILEHTNGAGSSLAVNSVGQTVVSANAADADGLNRYDLYGVYTCVDIDIATANPVTWTVWGLARK